MLDHRFEGEKNLANKLEGFDYEGTGGDLPKFEANHNQSLKKSVLWTVIKTLSIFSVLGVSIFLLLFENGVDPLSYGEENENLNSVVVKTQGEIDLMNDLQEESTLVDIEEESIEDTPIQLDEKVFNTATTRKVNNLSLNKSQGDTNERSIIKQESQVLNISLPYTKLKFKNGLGTWDIISNKIPPQSKTNLKNG